MAENPRKLLKLKLSTSGINPPPEPEAEKNTPKLKLKFGASKAAAPSPDAPAPSPVIKLSKPKKKDRPQEISTSKKKKRNLDSLSEDELVSGPRTVPGPSASKPKKIKLLNPSKKTPTTPFLKLKSKGRPPPRPPGIGYDSEASDKEIDPAIEEEFILRMQPGDDCDYLRKAIEEKRWGRGLDAADVRLKFLQSDGRRAVLIIRGKLYAATLIDMPCIIEGMKSWDKRGWYKAADICQMLLVLGPVKTEAEALTHPLPHGEVNATTFEYAHGLTPPMRWARKRRFRKRISTHTIEEVEAEVERLFRADAEAVEETKWELLDPGRLNREGRDGSAQTGSEVEDGEQDAEGEDVEVEGYFDGDAAAGGGENTLEVDDEALAAEYEAAMQEDDAAEPGGTDVVASADADGQTPAESSDAVVEAQIVTDSDPATPAGHGTTSKEDTGDEESDEDEEEEMDEDELEQRADLQRAREEIADLENAIRDQAAEMEHQQNNILRQKIQRKIESLRDDLELKKKAIGEGGEDSEG